MAKNIIGNLFPRIIDKPLPEAKSARGVWIEDSKGHRYLDASGGAIVVNVGHGREEIAKAVYEQILSCHYVHPTMFTTRPAELLATALANHTPEGLDRFYFLSSGSEAVETAIKLARQIHLADGRPQRFRLVARWKSYHGLSLGALSAMGRTAFRVPYAPMLSDAVHIPPPYCLRCSYGLTFPACDLRCALALAETIENVGPDIVSAFIAETVSGGTLAAYPPPEGYFKIIRKICDQYGILLIMDEVMCGMGRTGKWFACQHYDVIPEIITMGKGIAGGVLALSAVGVRSDHFETIRKKSGGFIHGGSFSHHPVAAAAGLATIGILEKDQLIERVARLGIDLGLNLKERLAEHPNVADVRGIGFLWGVELVKDKNGNRPFPRQDKVAERVWEALFQKGVLVYKSTGLAGKDGDAFLVAPPFVIGEDELIFVADTIKGVLEDVLA
jgi:adenosylmethionine-8-amino-7-oxononanoate aminotransferase